MKTICSSTLAASLAASATFAGGLSDPIIETPPAVVIEQSAAPSSGSQLIIPLIFTAFIAAALLNNG